MAITLEERRRYRELFWDDYHLVIKTFISHNPETDPLFPNKNKRLVQILLIYFMPEMWRIVDSATLKDRSQFISQQESLQLCGVTWFIKTGTVKVSIWAALKLASKFILFWTYVTSKSLFFSFFTGYAKKITLIFDVTRENYFRNGSLESFKNFLKKGPIKAFHEQDFFVIQGRSEDSQLGMWFSTQPLIESIRIKQADWFDPILVLFFQLQYFFLYFFYGFKDSKNWLLYKDLPYQGIAEFLNHAGFIQNVFQTQSGIQDQKLWFTDLRHRKFVASMLWYSVNSKAFRYYPDQGHGIHPYFLNSRTDVNYVWNEDEAKWIHQIAPHSKFEIVQPILFYLPELKPILKKTSQNQLNVVIFDVAPHVRSIYTPSFYSYHKTQNCLKFIDDIDRALHQVEQELKVKFNIYLKPKRPPSKSHHDPQYFDFVDSKNYFKLATQDNVFDLIDQADIVMVALYSSPMFISRKNNCIYYDPTGDVINDYPNYSFAQTVEELKKIISSKVMAKNDLISKEN